MPRDYRKVVARGRKMSIPKEKWEWFGLAGHFILGHQCQFHLCTLVGKYLVSTVGQYFPDAPDRDIIAESRGIKLTGIGPARRADYMNQIGYEEIGYNRTFETMVFRAGKRCHAKGCNCGQPRIAEPFEELDMDGYNDAKSAQQGHMELCEKWAKK